MAEKWKDIKGYENIYQVSNLGRIRSLDRIYVQPSRWGTSMLKKYKGKVLSPTDNGNGYLIISLRDDNRKRKSFYVHRLVAEHFLRKIVDGEVVNHLDYNKKNNNVENLEIISQKENVLYSISSMKKPRKRFKKSATGEKYIYFKGGKYVLCIRQFRFEKYFNTLEEAVMERDEFISGKEYFTK